MVQIVPGDNNNKWYATLLLVDLPFKTSTQLLDIL
jgi:hypothetical protein